MRADQISRFVSGHDFRGCGKGLERATSVRAWLRRRPFSKSVIPSGARNLLCVFDRPRMRREPIPPPPPLDKLRGGGFGMTPREGFFVAFFDHETCLAPKVMSNAVVF